MYFTLFDIFDSCLMHTMLLFGLIVCVMMGAYLFSIEYTENTLKTILTIPISKLSFITSKFLILFIAIISIM
ncbi:hypothetical protein ALNOE001_02860 [Candidatus Methanobinarius endosymbioticus]|uniref:ABC3 transporter permease protein domain-containing protein n=1 Tax=Candidatus Methanobinarius endosymbioticus TaxID=2006182 RepID=A0A366MDM9_9EURY|nr:hypothetical protein ALNOE001_02860 [Candidatus Methanobinarius endosymbioticus]